jgi:hypothetical protein
MDEVDVKPEPLALRDEIFDRVVGWLAWLTFDQFETLKDSAHVRVHREGVPA